MFLAARQRVARPAALALAASRRELATNTGKVKWFNTTRGYGFLTQEDGSDVFVHHTGIVADGYRSLADNEPVEFDIELQPNGKQALPLRLSLQEGAASGV